jgi:hypothetical protein
MHLLPRLEPIQRARAHTVEVRGIRSCNAPFQLARRLPAVVAKVRFKDLSNSHKSQGGNAFPKAGEMFPMLQATCRCRSNKRS